MNLEVIRDDPPPTLKYKTKDKINGTITNDLGTDKPKSGV